MSSRNVAKKAEILTRESTAKTEFELVPYNQIVQRPELYRHRDEVETREGLKALMDSLVVEGQLTPIEYFLDGTLKVAICGHRRLAACSELIKRKEPGFTEDMPIKAQRVEGSPQDFVCRSISDNVHRRTLTDHGKLSAVRAALDAGVPNSRAAHALDLPLTTYERYARLARNDAMRRHVEQKHIGFTDAVKLLAAAEGTNQLDRFLADFAGRVKIVEGRIEEMKQRRFDEKGEGLKDSEKEVRRHIESHVVAGWIARLKDGKPIGSEVPWAFKGRIENNELILPTIKLDLNTVEYDRLLRVASKLFKITQELKPILKRRELEAQAGGGEDDFEAELEYMQSAGLGGVEELREEAERRKRARAAEARDPAYGRVEPRREADPLADVEIPDADREEDDEDAGEEEAA